MIHKSKNICVVAIVVLLLLSIVSPITYAENIEENKLDVEARSGLLIEPNSGKILFEKNINEKFEPASVTKIMTMLLTMEAINSGKITMNDKVTVSENAKKMGGSTMLLDTGEIRTVEELLKGVAIASGNDAAVALGEYLEGSVEAFVGKMNARAKELGMTNTTFKNCTGLPEEGHLMSAYDISIMSRELLKHKDILKYTGTYMETISEGRKSPIEMVNHNKLVRFFNGCDGLKTGYTSKAKYCISATATRDDVRMLTVIVGAPTYKIRNRDASMLLNYGFGKFKSICIFKKDDDVCKIKFDKSGKKFVMAKACEDFKVTLERDQDENSIDKKVTIDKEKKVFKTGEKIGVCEFFMNEKSIGKIEVYTDRDMKVGGFFSRLGNNIKSLFDFSI